MFSEESYVCEQKKSVRRIVISREGKKQIRIAETEKYPHVTFFFSGGQETEFEGEKRLLPLDNVASFSYNYNVGLFHLL